MNFRNQLNEALPKVNSNIIGLTLDSFNIITQTHIYHLLTKSYAEHIAIGEFYEGLQDLVDVLAENSIALNVDTKTTEYNSKIKFSYSKAALVQEIEAYRTNVTSFIASTDKPELTSINDAVIGIQKCIDVLLYKLQLG